VMEGLKSSRNYSMMLELFSQMPSLGVNRDSRHVSLAVTVSHADLLSSLTRPPGPCAHSQTLESFVSHPNL
jgi:hypothetical protein